MIAEGKKGVKRPLRERAKPRWYHNIATIREALEIFDGEYLNRASIEAAFRLPRRAAGRLIAELAGDRSPASRTEEILVRRVDVIGWLKRLEAGQDYANERHRREAVATHLRELRAIAAGLRERELEAQRERDAERLRFLVPKEAHSRPSLELLEGVRVEPGKVTFTFDDPAKAYPMFFAFAKAVGANYPAFEAAASLEPGAVADRLRRGLIR